MMTSFFGTNTYANEQTGEIQLAEQSASAIVIERDTGQVLFEKNSHEQLPPASMTKIMTMLLIMERIDNGTLSYDEKVRTSENAASMGGSQVFLEPGEEMTVTEMLKAIAVASGNDASVAMAEHIAGTEEEFVSLMNDKAKELGLKNTNFINSNGLPAENHYTTAHDLAVISKELLKYEDITKFTSIYEDYLRKGTDKEFWLVNTNKLVKFYDGVDGLKTGFTKEAMYCLTATAEKNGMRVISIVMGAPTPKERNSQITEMLDYSFSQYMTHPMYEKDQLMGEIEIIKGDKKVVSVLTSESISLLTKKGESVDEVVERIKWNDELRAPIQKGEQVATLILEQDGKILSESPLVAADDVESASWWQLFKRVFSKFGGN
ncbi:D-alanyl-D-alanine carboxypeptidase family protein [Alkalihalobacillus trypoxylicola]|uniref:serine-type D-Ala-D-Ala carboxypeptidase n=1 Tax=Alkalihalobacillus trypoxylicola TaxID=519424 RepID=A0A161PD73_9BACI|nr:D-alanyl-D-alanine carboxypeptidase family protein [Alkalihalobacillus trypoxylicola]KYG30731.1 D-alanyl-D-alanine carboxypeptidase [Alkalihalobacillus trypoxylicola]